MKCAACGHEFRALNQNSMCDRCGTVVGTDADLIAEHTRVVRWFDQYETTTQAARDLAHTCRDYVDGEQWSEQDKAKLKERHQAPTVINRIFKKIMYLVGLEIESRTDPKALPRTPVHELEVQAATDALRYVADVEDFDETASCAWEEKLVEGASAAVVEVDKSDDDLPIKIRHVEYDRFFYDPHSKKHDFSDAKYLGISTWMDLEDAIDYFEAREDAVENAAEVLEQSLQSYGEGEAHADKPTALWADKERNRVRWTETYYRLKGKWHVCLASKAGFLVKPKPTGYVDEKGRDICPLVADSALIDRQCQRYGLVKHMLGVQDEINKRRSKALRWLSTDRVVAEEGAILDPDEAQTEWAKPDGWVTVQRDALQQQRVQFTDGAGKAAQQMQAQAQSNSEIDMVGPDAPQIGTMAGQQSGRALMMRQKIGNLELARIIDHHRRWKRAVYRHVWYAVRQFWTTAKWLRVNDDAEKTGFRFVAINKPMTRAERVKELVEQEVPFASALSAAAGAEAAPALLKKAAEQHKAQMAQLGPAVQQIPPEQHEQMVQQLALSHPAMQQQVTAHDVAQLDVDIIIDESPDTAILQIEEYEAYMQTLPTLVSQDPQNAKQYLAIGLELSGSRYKNKVLQILQAPQQQDPQVAQAQAQAQQMQAAMAQANVASLQAKAQRDQAAAVKAAAEAQQGAQVDQAAQAREMAQAQKLALEAKLVVPATAHLQHAQAAKAEAETRAAPVEAAKTAAEAQKLAAEAAPQVVVAVPAPRGGPNMGGMMPGGMRR